MEQSHQAGITLLYVDLRNKHRIILFLSFTYVSNFSETTYVDLISSFLPF